MNIHTKILPEYKRIIPNYWVLSNSETQKKGTTIQLVDFKMNTDDIVLIKETLMKPDETLHSVNSKVGFLIDNILIENIIFGNTSTLTTIGRGAYFFFLKKRNI